MCVFSGGGGGGGAVTTLSLSSQLSESVTALLHRDGVGWDVSLTSHPGHENPPELQEALSKYLDTALYDILRSRKKETRLIAFMLPSTQ